MTAPPRIIDMSAIVADLSLPHEAIPQGVPVEYSWYNNGVIGMGTNPLGPIDWPGPPILEWRAFLPWWTIYFAPGHTATNSCVRLLGMDAAFLLKSTRKWQLLQSAQTPGTDGFGEYSGDFTAALGLPAFYRFESNGDLSTVPGVGNCVHGWTTRFLTPWSIWGPDIAAICISITHRLGLINTGGTDDRANARLLVNAGADYWPGLTTTLNDIAPANILPGSGLGRFKFCVPQIRRSTFFCSEAPLTGNQLKALFGFKY